MKLAPWETRWPARSKASIIEESRGGAVEGALCAASYFSEHL